MDAVVMALDLTQVHKFYCHLVNGVQMLLFLVWTIVYQGIVITKEKHPDKGTTDELDDTKYSVNITNSV